MMQKSVGTKVARFVLKDIVFDLITWPLWWYSAGLIDAFFRMVDTFRQANDEVALTIWIKNIFVPMYGDYSWQGRLISFFMRVVQIIIRGLLVFGWFVFAIFVFLIWILLPLFVLYQLIYNLNLLA